MAMGSCRECKGAISTKAEVCPHCGYRQRDGKGFKVVRALFGLFVGVGMVIVAVSLMQHT